MQDSTKMYEKQALIADFQHECSSYLDKIGELLFSVLNLVKQKKASSPQIINELFRLVHTIKGTSAYMGFTPIKSLAHSFEHVLQELRDGKYPISESLLSVLIKAYQELLILFQALENRVLHEIDVSGVVRMLESAKLVSPAQGAVSADPDDDFLKIPTHKTLRIHRERYTEMLALIQGATNDVEDFKKCVFELDERLLELKERELLKGEHFRAVLNSSQSLEFLSEILSKRVDGIRAYSLLSRMQPVGGLLKRFKNLLMDLSDKQGKSCIVKLKGLDIEADTLICDALGAILVHMVRNIVDHGIEPKIERFTRGKSEAALVKIAAKVDADFLIIEMSDDGRGIDAEAIAGRALAKGLVSEAQLLEFDHAQKVQLMFHPGISTASEVTETSGRGVGMDVVLRTIQEMGGSIRVFTQMNLGTKFVVRLPLVYNLSSQDFNCESQIVLQQT